MVMRVKVPESCADLWPPSVERALHKHFGHIPAAARELGVSAPDLRRLTWAQPSLLEHALEDYQELIDKAMGRVIEALDSPDWRRRAWGCDKIMNSYLARNHPLSPGPRVRGSGNGGVTVRYAIRWQNEASK
jgi:hypothetical protein